MFTAYSAYKFRTCGTAFFYSHLYKLANTVLVENLERVDIEDFFVEIYRQEACDVVSAISKCHLCQVICSKAEVFSFLRNSVCRECCTRYFNHCSDTERNFYAFFGKQFFCCVTYNFFLHVKLIDNTNKRNHDFRSRIESLFLQLNCGAQDCPCLHCSNFRICIAKSATTMSKHRIMLTKAIDSLLYLLNCYAHFLSHNFLSLEIVGNKFVQRRIKQTNVHWITIHCFKDAVEILFLIWQKFCKSFFATFNSI